VIIWEWINLHNEELYGLYSSPNTIWVIRPRIMRLLEHVACMGERKDVCSVLVGKPEGNNSLRSPRHRWEAVLNSAGYFWTS
jgi:hypothetical protein